jgi:hypothetical protein
MPTMAVIHPARFRSFLPLGAVVAAILLTGSSPAGAQQFFTWSQSPAPAQDHLGNTLAAGSLVQLIVTTSTPRLGDPPEPNSGDINGLNAGETLAAFGVSSAGGNFSEFYGDIAGLGGESAVIFARVFEQPSQNVGTGNLPATVFEAGLGDGIWYAEMPVSQIVPDVGNGGDPFFNYLFDVNGGQAPPNGSGSWQFLIVTPVPEPATWALLLAGGLLLIRRARSR